jgi:hypothetical protein
MTKGKPWTVDEETALKDMIEANTPLEVMATKLNKKPDTIYVKCVRLGLKKKIVTSSGIPLPKKTQKTTQHQKTNPHQTP